MATTVIKQCICCGLSEYNFSSLMKHKTENTHITHFKAAVRLQWRDSMAQHGRLVIFCTETLHIQHYQHIKPHQLFVSEPRRWSVGVSAT